VKISCKKKLCPVVVRHSHISPCEPRIYLDARFL
jgi:hypothetical protein